jgi:diadenosine tetraphosphatase ApaH/serine/threonine PP2A family protein phosphatase
MRYAVVSDVHGNLEALRAVLADAAERADGVLCLGDVVGYGADPEACMALVDESAAVVLAGNHEHGVSGALDLRWFNAAARTALVWTRSQLDADGRAWLGSRPLVADVEDATLVHASPAAPDEWDYLVTPNDGFGVFGAFQSRVCFVGHTHVPTVWSVGSSGRQYQQDPTGITLEDGRRYVLNVGSVGQPRDGDTRASYAVWDVESRAVSFRRVPYDVQTARRKILDAGLPRRLSDRLAVGS